MNVHRLVLLAVCVVIAFVCAAARPSGHGAIHQDGEKYVETPRVPLDASIQHRNLTGYHITNSYVVGLSSGGYMAGQLHVAYSSRFKGVAIMAAGPYYCAVSQISRALYACVDDQVLLDLPALETYAQTFAASGWIDTLSNIAQQPVYIFHGQSDSTVKKDVVQAVYKWYTDFGANVTFNSETLANHAWISPYGANPCSVSELPYTSNCPGIDIQNEILTHFWGQSPAPKNNGALTGQLYAFSQDFYSQLKYFQPAAYFSMDSTGYVYVPQACANGQNCELILALHGCQQGYSVIGSALLDQSNLHQYADTNNLIVLWPQAIKSLTNPQGCWDWWGYTPDLTLDVNYAIKGAPQMELILAFMNALGA